MVLIVTRCIVLISQIIVLCIAMCGLTLPVSAAVVADLYQAQIPVADQENDSRNLALPIALQTVLVKVSGQTDFTKSPLIKRALANPTRLIEQYSYIGNPDPATNVAQPYILTVNFAQNGINDLLLKADKSVWGKNRPSLLIWIVQQSTSSQMPSTSSNASVTNNLQLIGAKSPGDIANQVQQVANSRGLPLLFPLLDDTDASAVLPVDVLNNNITTLTQASSRYGADGMVTVQLLSQDNNEINSIWTLILNGNLISWQIKGTVLPDITLQGMNKLADLLAAQFAHKATQAQHSVILNIYGINNLTALEDVKSYLSHLTSVYQLSLVSVKGSKISLQLGITGDTTDLQTTLKFDRKLSLIAATPVEPTANLASPSAISSLDYKWNN